MFEWGFDKPTQTPTFDQTISQDIMDFNTFVKQNVSNNINTQPAPNSIPPMNFSGNALSNIKQEQPVIDYMTYNTPQPDEIPDLGNQEQKNITNQEYTGLLDAQEGLNPYG